jgi:HPr kinase/phosphorylase
MTETPLHATCVAIDGRGLLILGAAGSGKSALALDLIALGVDLVADDRVQLARDGDRLSARPVARLSGLIEARGIGLLRLPHRAPVALVLAIDLDKAEPLRLPVRRSMTLLGIELPLILRPEPLRPSAILAALRHGPPLDPEAPLDAADRGRAAR